MGKYEVGVLGNFDGKIGTVVGAKWKGIEYMRQKGRKSKKTRTELQLEQQARFAMVTKFVNKFANLLRATYPDTPELTSVNHAFANIYAKAIIGNYPVFDLDYSKVSLSKGDLHNAYSPAATAAGNGMIKFNWTDNSDGNMANEDDRSVLVAYCPELELTVYTLNGAQRNTGAASLNAINFIGKLVETWVSFISANGKFAATSIHTGQLLIS